MKKEGRMSNWQPTVLDIHIQALYLAYESITDFCANTCNKIFVYV